MTDTTQDTSEMADLNNNDVSSWFQRKKDQLCRLQGNVPIPGSKPKAKKAKLKTRADECLKLSKANKESDENVAVVPDSSVMVKDKCTAVLPDNSVKAKEKCTTWMEAAQAAGVMLVPHDHEEETFEENKEVEEDIPIVEHVDKVKKRKTPKEKRTEDVKVMTDDKISESNKKTFKEAFNTDKSRLENRQVKYNRPQNFLIIMEDNINSAACTNGKLMVYGKGKICEDFFKDGINYNKAEYFVHKNVHNFEEDKKVSDGTKKVNKNAIIDAEPGCSKPVKQKKAPLSKYDIFLAQTKKASNNESSDSE